MSKNKFIESNDNNQKHLACQTINQKTDVFPLNSDNDETVVENIKMISKSGRESTESFKNETVSMAKKNKCEVRNELGNETAIDKYNTPACKNRSASKLSSPVINIHPNDDSSTDGDNIKANSNNIHDKSMPINANHSSSGSENVEQKSSEKCRFEEVEIKLEEMFAGIEDEQSTHINNEPISKTINSIADNELITDSCKGKLPIKLPEKTIQTKAAVKSTECVLPTDNYKCTYPPSDSKSSVEPDSNYTFMKNVQPRRRLSVAIDHSSRRLPEKQSDLNAKETNPLKTESLLTNANNSEAIVKDVIHNSNSVSKKKSCANNRKHHNETKRESLSNSKLKKKRSGKAEELGSAKSRQQKFKNRRMNNFSSSDNENEPEERIQQTRDMDTKYRSPFVFIKTDGAISIVNTATADDCSDKNNKVKKSGIYVPERKNLKGIYSSTLSNKYDADTADSTWICVFCKQGPHKKGLGDLFGPYAVSLDCDEYRMAANVNVAEFNKRRKINAQVEANDVLSCPIGSSNTQPITHESIMQQLLHGQEIMDEHLGSPHQICVSNMPRISSNNFEIWFHEDCAVWAPNIFLVGSRLVGLDSAIWNSTRHKCAICQKTGAIICCLRRDCKETAHLICARENTWLLDDSKLWAYCAKHAPK